MKPAEEVEVPKFARVARYAIAPFDLGGPCRALGFRIQGDDVDLSLLPSGVVEMLDDLRVVEPLGIECRLGDCSHALIILARRAKESSAHGGIGQVDFEGCGTLEVSCILIDPMNAANQKGCLEILEVAGQGGLCDAGGFGEFLKGDFVAGIVSEGGEEAVQLLDVADAVELREVAQEDLVDDVALDKAGRVVADGGIEDCLGVAPDIQVGNELAVQRLDVGRDEFIFLNAYQGLLFLNEGQVLSEGKRREQELGEATGS